MEALVIEPRTKNEARFVRDFTERLGIPAKSFEEIDDALFAQKLLHLDKVAKPVSNEELDATFDKLLGRK